MPARIRRAWGGESNNHFVEYATMSEFVRILTSDPMTKILLAIATGAVGYGFAMLRERGQVRSARTAAHVSDLRAELSGFWEPLKQQIVATRSAFDLQARWRAELWALLTSRNAITTEIERITDWSERLETIFPAIESQPEEPAYYRFVRSLTYGPIYDANSRELELIMQNPSYGARLPRLRELLQHLQAWTAKADTVRNDHGGRPALVYVGVKEKVPFPRGIETEIDAIVADLKHEIANLSGT